MIPALALKSANQILMFLWCLSGKCAHRCVGNDTCACFKGYKLKPDGKSCEGKLLLYCYIYVMISVLYFNIRTVFGDKENTFLLEKTNTTEPQQETCDVFLYCLSCFFADINECLVGASNCRGGERCINTEGSFRCQREVSCGTGYELTDSNNCKGLCCL